VDLTAGVAVRLSALCLDAAGRLGDYPLWHTAVRGALLVDLALAGRLAQTDDSIVIDATPTGFGPADALLGAIAVEPERSLDWWMTNGGVRLRDLAAANPPGPHRRVPPPTWFERGFTGRGLLWVLLRAFPVRRPLLPRPRAGGALSHVHRDHPRLDAGERRERRLEALVGLAALMVLVDVYAERAATGRWFVWLQVLIWLPQVVQGRWEDPGVAVPGAVLLGAGLLGVLVWHRRLAVASRRWLNDPPGPSRDPRYSPPPERPWTVTGRQAVLLLVLVNLVGRALTAAQLALV